MPLGSAGHLRDSMGPYSTSSHIPGLGGLNDFLGAPPIGGGGGGFSNSLNYGQNNSNSSLENSISDTRNEFNENHNSSSKTQNTNNPPAKLSRKRPSNSIAKKAAAVSSDDETPKLDANGKKIKKPNGIQLSKQEIKSNAQNFAHNDANLDSFVEHFKNRRVKIGASQKEVGAALKHLEIPGFGSVSQATISRFETHVLTRTHMVALKPVLMAWLDEAERAKNGIDGNGYFDNGKRKRTVISDADKQHLELYFETQPRPGMDEVGDIAERLNLSAGVVRVWFSNQRARKKRLGLLPDDL